MYLNITILLVEDDEADVILVTRAINKQCPRTVVHPVSNAGEAIAYLRGDPPYQDRGRYRFPDVLLTDVKMPGSGGFELLAWMQENEQFRVVPSIVLTSSPDPDDISKAYCLGANTYFVKPVAYADLVELVRVIGQYWRLSALPTSCQDRHRAVALSAD